MMIAWKVERYGEVESTNALALERVRAAFNGQSNEGPVDGLVIVAERQTGGRGQHGRTWESPAGGLYMSAVIEQVAPERRNLLALIAGVAVARTLQELGHAVKLQWPNDIVTSSGGKKLGGILCEAAANGTRWAGIVGIGLNVNTAIADLPAALRSRATSLLAQTGRKSDTQTIEHRILSELAAVLQRVSEDGITKIIETARDLDALRGQWVQLQNGDDEISAAGAGIGDAGELLLDTSDGVRGFATGTIVAINGTRLRGSPANG
jgi:BirA family biotin operon repressor/biotin-[acetyl-CoA-carboxylase] ligase